MHQLINQDSGNYEYYTPSHIVDLARQVFITTSGHGIDLDPFSSEKANLIVGAKRIYTEADDGLSKDWKGNVWMNHPFGREMNKKAIQKLVSEYKNGNIHQACCITFAATSEEWYRPLLAFPQCYIHGRTNYYLPDGTLKKGVTKGSVVTYLGEEGVDEFRKVFSSIGTVKL